MSKKFAVTPLGFTAHSWSRHVNDRPKDFVYTMESFSTPSYADKKSWTSKSNKSLTPTRNLSRKTGVRKVWKHIEDYLRHSTLHGLRYVGDNTISYGERLFWLISFVLAVSFAVYFINSIYTKYNINPVIVTINPNPTSVEEVPFPAVTICNMNAATKKESEIIMAKGTATDKSYLDDICEFDDPGSSANSIGYQTGDWQDVFKFMSKVSQPCEKMLKVCKWRLRDVDCNLIFKPIVTDEGLCCNFNQLPMEYILRDPGNQTKLNTTYNYNKYQIDDWNSERGYSPNASYDVFPFRSPGPGAHLGLTLVLDADVDNYYCSSGSSVGFKMLLHTPAEIPKMTDFAFMLPPGCEVRVVFKPTINDATASLKGLDVKKRHCYFDQERHLHYYRTYAKVNCKMECLANITLKRCGCVPYYLPQSTSTKVCGKMQEACSNNVRGKTFVIIPNLTNFVEMLELKEMPSSEEKACDCLPACFQLDYEKSMSYGRIADTFKIKHDIIRNESLKYFKTNMLVVQVYFVSTQFSKFTKSELYGFSEFLSNTGGILGLFLGFSFLSIVEIFYHLTLKILCHSIRFPQRKSTAK